MTRKALDQIMAGVEDVHALAEGRADPAGYRVHPARDVDARAIRLKLKLTQEAFARDFGLTVGAVRDWEQNRRGPDRAAQVLLTVIDAAPDVVRRALAEAGEVGADLSRA